MKNRDRAMQFEVDSDVKAVLEFMQTNIPADRLVGIAESVGQIGRLLWGHFRQEPVRAVSLLSVPINPCAKQSTATVLAGVVDADGDSVEAAVSQQPQ